MPQRERLADEDEKAAADVSAEAATVVVARLKGLHQVMCTAKILTRAWIAMLVAFSTVAGVAGLIWCFRHQSREKPIAKLYKDFEFAEVFRISAPCLKNVHPDMREGLSFGWPGPETERMQRPVRYGVWFLMVQPKATGIFVNVGRTIALENREEGWRITGKKQDTRWCEYARANGFDSIQIRLDGPRRTHSELVLCDDANTRAPSLGPCASGLLFRAGGALVPCNCSQIPNSVNCVGDDHARLQSCSDAHKQFDALARGGGTKVK